MAKHKTDFTADAYMSSCESNILSGSAPVRTVTKRLLSIVFSPLLCSADLFSGVLFSLSSRWDLNKTTMLSSHTVLFIVWPRGAVGTSLILLVL